MWKATPWQMVSSKCLRKLPTSLHFLPALFKDQQKQKVAPRGKRPLGYTQVLEGGTEKACSSKTVRYELQLLLLRTGC